MKRDTQGERTTKSRNSWGAVVLLFLFHVNDIHARRFKRSIYWCFEGALSKSGFYPGYGGTRTFTVLRDSCPAGHFYRLTPKCPHFYPTPTLWNRDRRTARASSCSARAGAKSHSSGNHSHWRPTPLLNTIDFSADDSQFTGTVFISHVSALSTYLAIPSSWTG